MSMELSKHWEASDYRALFKRIDVARGWMQADAEKICPADIHYWQVAKSCEEFLKAYKSLPNSPKPL